MKMLSLRSNVRLLGSIVVLATILAAASEYRLINRIAIPGDYGWDYLTADSKGRRLYVSHDQEVVVLDLDSKRSSAKSLARVSTALPLSGTSAVASSAPVTLVR